MTRQKLEVSSQKSGGSRSRSRATTLSAASPGVSRRDFLRSSALGGALAVAGPITCGPAPSEAPAAPAAGTVGDEFALEETTIAALQDGMTTGEWIARSITEAYLARIEQVNLRGRRCAPCSKPTRMPSPSLTSSTASVGRRGRAARCTVCRSC